jgi:hypothetical protein
VFVFAIACLPPPICVPACKQCHGGIEVCLVAAGGRGVGRTGGGGRIEARAQSRPVVADAKLDRPVPTWLQHTQWAGVAEVGSSLEGFGQRRGRNARPLTQSLDVHTLTPLFAVLHFCTHPPLIISYSSTYSCLQKHRIIPEKRNDLRVPSLPSTSTTTRQQTARRTRLGRKLCVSYLYRHRARPGKEQSFDKNSARKHKDERRNDGCCR